MDRSEDDDQTTGRDSSESVMVSEISVWSVRADGIVMGVDCRQAASREEEDSWDGYCGRGLAREREHGGSESRQSWTPLTD
jgi:hypothetical protein